MSDESYGSDEGFRRGAENAGDEGSPPIDEALEALAHPVRRSILYSLREEEAETVEEVTRAVADERAGASSEDAAARRDRVESGLVHAHLPKLDRSGLLEYDRDDGAIDYSSPPEPLDGIVELLAGFEE